MATYVGNSGTIKIYPISSSQRFLRYNWEITDIDYINLTSTFHWTVTFVDTIGGVSTSTYLRGYVTTDYGTDNEQRVDWAGNFKIPGTVGEWVFKEGTHTIQHDSNGYKTNMRVWFNGQYNGGSADQYPTITLNAISAKPTISGVTNTSGSTLYDDDDFIITYTNPAGTLVDSLQAGIAYDRNSTMDVEYMDIPKDATSTTLQLNATQRAALYAYYSSTTSNKFYFLIKVVFQGVTYTDYISATINLRNYSPTLSPTLVDSNSSTVALTGSNKTLVKYMSNVAYTIGAAAIKGATITEQSVTNGKTYTDATGTISNVESSTFYFSAKDSRGSVVNEEIIFNNNGNLKWVEYIKLTANISSIKFNTNGSLDITVTGKYFNGSFGNQSNTLTIYYEVHPSTSAAGSWKSLGVVTPTVDADGSYTYSFTISGYDYLTRYEVSIKASDKLMSTDAVTKQVAAVPVFDWGESDFKFNVPVNMSQGYTVPLNSMKQLWNGNYQFNGTTTTINLTTPISELPNGIVLVFAYTDGTTVFDTNVQSFFVSKKAVQVRGTASHTFFLMSSANFGAIGAKTLQISDSQITGNTLNGNKGTANGITYDNSKFVLRDVLGV